MTPNILKAMSWFDASSQFMWFDLGRMTPQRHADVANRFNAGGIPEILHSDLPPEELPMPFEQVGTVIEYYGDNARIPPFAVTFLRHDGQMQVVFHGPSKKHLVLNHVGPNSKIKSSKGDLWCDGPMVDEYLNNPINKLSGKGLDHLVNLYTEIARRVYATLYIELVDKKQRVPGYQPIPSPRNAKRISKGKVPLFEWKVIDVTASHIVPEGGTPTGRTHASPRRHSRRGHMRRYKSGKTVWIKQMMVGKIEFGYIHHSYTTEKELANA